MKFIIVFCFIIGSALSAPATYNQFNRSEKNSDQEATIIRSSSSNDGMGNYEFEFETSDGQIRKERGELVQIGAEDPIIKVTGSYTYRDPENVVHTINYVADENGYRANDSGTRQAPPSITLTQRVQSSPEIRLGILGSINQKLG